MTEMKLVLYLIKKVSSLKKKIVAMSEKKSIQIITETAKE